MQPEVRRDAGVCLAWLMPLLAWDAAGADAAVMQAVGSAQGFALRHAWLTERVLHDGGQWLSVAVWLGLIVNVWRPWPLLPRALAAGASRSQRGWLLAAVCAGLLIVSVMKRHSLTSCPWDTLAHGGVAQQVSHWAWGLVDGGPGRCFPSGHASRAFSLLAGWFLLRQNQASPRVLRGWLLGVGLAGALMGGAQVLRGAHPPSHVFWTAWLSWASSTVLWHGWQGWQIAGMGRDKPRKKSWDA